MSHKTFRKMSFDENVDYRLEYKHSARDREMAKSASRWRWAAPSALDADRIDLEYEWRKMGAEGSVPIPGKYCNEFYLTNLAKQEVTGELPEEVLGKYNKQIVMKIGL